jgi:hypothetical protein
MKDAAYRCYFKVNLASWSGASSECDSAGADLFVTATASDVALAAGLGAVLWVSSADLASTGTWLTAKGQPVPATFWAPGQPAATASDGKPAHCTLIGTSGAWETDDCAAMHGAVCRRDPPK